jgi:NTP pyrophosphatase (non-canonical NTP hydrolase)
MATTICLEVSVGVDVPAAALEHWVFSQLNMPGVDDRRMRAEDVRDEDLDALDEFDGDVEVSRFVSVEAQPSEPSRGDLFAEAVALWGRGFQVLVVCEECGELVSALSQYNRGRISAPELAEEVADVSIMLEQIPYIAESGNEMSHEFSALVARKKETKLARLEAMVAAARRARS